MASEGFKLQHLVEPLQPDQPRRSRFPTILGVVLLGHVVILTALVILDMIFTPPDMRATETPVEVIVEPPPPPAPPPKPEPEPQPKEEAKPEEKKPDPAQSSYYEKPATDAPRAQNEETVERPAKDKETKAQRKAPPPRTAQKPAPRKQPSLDEAAAAKEISEKTAALKPAEEKPDAETVEQADVKQEQIPEKESLAETQGETKKGVKSLAEELTAPDPAPQYMFSGAAKAAPVSGGKADRTYLSILWGLIVPGVRIPENIEAAHQHREGIAVFTVDIKGNLSRIEIRKSSGLPELDAAAIEAVRRAAPFPPPPRGLVYPINFQFTSN